MINIVLIAFIIGLLSIATKIGADIIQQRKCIDDESMQNYLTGRFSKDDATRRRITAHLGICKDCQQRIKTFSFEDRIEDHLVEWEKAEENFD